MNPPSWLPDADRADSRRGGRRGLVPERDRISAATSRVAGHARIALPALRDGDKALRQCAGRRMAAASWALPSVWGEDFTSVPDRRDADSSARGGGRGGQAFGP